MNRQGSPPGGVTVADGERPVADPAQRRGKRVDGEERERSPQAHPVARPRRPPADRADRGPSGDRAGERAGGDRPDRTDGADRAVARLSQLDREARAARGQRYAGPRGPGGRNTRERAEEDPRFAARRAAVAADRRRDRLQRYSVLGLLPAVIAAAVWVVLWSPAADVDRVTVSGAEMTGAPGAAAAAGLRPGDALATADLTAVEDRLEALPWIEKATAARAWPDTVRVAVVERRPLAQVAEPGGGWFLIDPTGRLLDAVPQRRPDLIELDGLLQGGAPGVQLVPTATEALAMIPRFPDAVRAQVARIQIGDDGTVSFFLRPTLGLGDAERADLDAAIAELQSEAAASGQPLEAAHVVVEQAAFELGIPEPLVRFGKPERVDEKLITLATVLSKVDPRCMLTIDLRVPRKATVERRYNCDE